MVQVMFSSFVHRLFIYLKGLEFIEEKKCKMVMDHTFRVRIRVARNANIGSKTEGNFMMFILLQNAVPITGNLDKHQTDSPRDSARKKNTHQNTPIIILTIGCLNPAKLENNILLMTVLLLVDYVWDIVLNT